MTLGDHPPLDWRVIRFQEITSTMDAAADLARDAAPAGTVVIAEYQSEGRGQRGRFWHAPPGASLLATIVLRPAFRVATDPTLSRQIAEQVARALAHVTGINPVVKDPNDVLINGHKVCGILCQTSLRGDAVDYLLIGIGLNVNLERSDLPFETATSVLVETGRRHDRERILHGILTWLCDIPGLCDEVPRRPQAPRSSLLS